MQPQADVGREPWESIEITPGDAFMQSVVFGTILNLGSGTTYREPCIVQGSSTGVFHAQESERAVKIIPPERKEARDGLLLIPVEETKVSDSPLSALHEVGHYWVGKSSQEGRLRALKGETG
jgi:hypothetical protein